VIQRYTFLAFSYENVLNSCLILKFDYSFERWQGSAIILWVPYICCRTIALRLYPILPVDFYSILAVEINDDKVEVNVLRASA